MVHFHFTPTHASWLNQIEIWFSLLSRYALKSASFTSVKQLRQAIDDFIAAHNERGLVNRCVKEFQAAFLSRDSRLFLTALTPSTN
jgi:hypothetical protein